MAQPKKPAPKKTPSPIDMVKGMVGTRKKLLNALTPKKK
jgi:hypothetical protein